MGAGDGSAVSILQWWPSLIPHEIHQEQAASSPIDSSKPQTHPTKLRMLLVPPRGTQASPVLGPCLLSMLEDASALLLQQALAKSPCPMPRHHLNPHLLSREAADAEGLPPSI